jgi:23S rRNA pseudouridine2605 synthase
MSDNRDQKNRGPRKPGGAGKGGPRKPGGAPGRGRMDAGDAPRGKPPGKFAGKTFGDKPAGRTFGDKPAGRTFAGKPGGSRFGDKPAGDKRFGERPPRREGAAPARGERSERRFDKPDFEKRPPRVEKPRRVLREPQSEPSAFEGERIAKVMARVGLCSRRDAEVWIAEGRVTVNGEVLTTAAVNVTSEDRVTIDGKPLAARERTRLFMFHKPRGLVTTDYDPEGRPTIFDALPENLPRLVSIGRLDINTEGLLLLTNDGGLARVLELPSTGWLRRYRVRANGSTDQAKLDALREGITIDGIEYAGIEAHLDREQGANCWITMGLREGKNREIKRVLEHLGLAVNRLIRLSYGPFQLGDLEEGMVEEVRTRVLMDQIGPTLAQEAGADFDSSLVDRTPLPDAPEPGARKPRGKPGPVRGYEEEAERPRKDRPVAGPRKHVTVLRATRDEPVKGGNEKTQRRRIERASTSDRKGRSVDVERIVAPRARPAAKAAGRFDDKAASGTRNARRFASERDGTAGERPRTGRNAKDAGKRPDRRGEKPRNTFMRDAGAPEQAEHKPWGDKPRGHATSGLDRPERSEFKPRGEFKGKPRGEGKPRGDFAPRGEGKPRGDFPPRGDRPAGKFAGKPGGRPAGKFGGGKPGGRPGGKPSGKPGGAGPRGPRTPR